MSHTNQIKLEGVIPATLLAFDKDFNINEKSSRKHIRDCAVIDGISALTINGHSSEVHACNFKEQKRILRDILNADKNINTISAILEPVVNNEKQKLIDDIKRLQSNG